MCFILLSCMLTAQGTNMRAHNLLFLAKSQLRFFSAVTPAVFISLHWFQTSWTHYAFTLNNYKMFRSFFRCTTILCEETKNFIVLSSCFLLYMTKKYAIKKHKHSENENYFPKKYFFLWSLGNWIKGTVSREKFSNWDCGG